MRRQARLHLETNPSGGGGGGGRGCGEMDGGGAFRHQEHGFLGE